MQSCRPFRQFPFSRLFRHVACMAVILLCIGAGAWGDINWVKSGKDSHLSSDSDNDAYIVNIVGDYTVTDYWKIGKVIINLNDNVVTIKTLMYGVQNKLNLNCSFFVKGSGTLIIENLIANVSADSSSEAGSISINDYLNRIAYFTKMEESTLILVLIYIDRICNYTNIQLTYNNIYKLLIASTFVAIKFNEDSHYSLSAYAKIGRISPSELSYLEFHFLLLINFDLNVDTDLYNKYSESLLSCQDDSDEEDEEEESDLNDNEDEK